ncbi:MAG TPA: arylsulfatase [Thermogutta sp.]|nr:arylsulfatase [Thermogutta sp.]HPU06828.1 arylsulfatase [Thermogutta sp.]HQF12910.1 arylsulfatase [Thermogutta sp.]
MKTLVTMMCRDVYLTWVSWLLMLTLLASLGLVEASQGSGAERPNVVLVITDDQGYGDLACHGNPVIKTPNLDRLYQESVRLTDFHVDPTCSPTRAALMTGRYSCRTGVWHTIMGRSILRRDETTMADVFRRAGYRTAIFGKWHLGDNYPYHPWNRGFEECLIHFGGGIGQGPDYWGNTYFSPTLNHNGEWKKEEGYCTDIFFKRAMEFIQAHREEPFFVYLPTNAPHAPLQVEERYAEPYRQAGLPDALAKFYGMITNIDENMGRLMGLLRELKLESQTILIFMTDNGTAGSGFNAGMRGKKGSQYDGGHRVPCFIRWPGRLPAGQDFTHLAAHIDLFPTLLDLCDIPAPSEVKFDGISLKPYLAGGTATFPERTLFVQVNRIDHPVPWRLSAVLTERYRLIDGQQLYDIKEDPGQTKDIAAANAEVVNELRARYEAWYADVSQRFGEYCELVLGSDEENPATLCSHDWHGESVPWDQSQMEKGMVGNGFWAVEFAKAGRYRFALRDRPAHASTKLPQGKARLVVEGLFEEEKPIPANAEEIIFEANLPAGKARLQTFLTLPNGTQRGFYFVVVTRLP